jgi:hypothetical protein
MTCVCESDPSPKTLMALRAAVLRRAVRLATHVVDSAVRNAFGRRTKMDLIALRTTGKSIFIHS